MLQKKIVRRYFFSTVLIVIGAMLAAMEAGAVSNTCQAGPYQVTLTSVVPNTGGSRTFNYRFAGSSADIRKLTRSVVVIDKEVGPSAILNGATSPPCVGDSTRVGKGDCKVFTWYSSPQPGPNPQEAIVRLITTYPTNGSVTYNADTGATTYTCVGTIMGPGDGIDPNGVYTTERTITPNPETGNLCPVKAIYDAAGKCVNVELAPNAALDCQNVTLETDELMIGGNPVHFLNINECDVAVGTTDRCVYYKTAGGLKGYGPHC